LIEFCPALQERFAGDQAFEQVLATDGKVYRDFKGRRTLRFEHAGKGYYLKIHPGIGWAEILRALLQGKLPVLGAQDEYRAILALQQAGVRTMTIAGYGVRHSNPARRESFIITEEIGNAVSLEELIEGKGGPTPTLRKKRVLIREVAAIARAMHRRGVNHRDFYLCHFLLPEQWLVRQNGEAPPLHVIDLHRAQVRRRVPLRWRLKDLAGLHFSSMNAGLTQRDRLLFIACYENRPLRQVAAEPASLWTRVDRQARKRYKKFQRKYGAPAR